MPQTGCGPSPSASAGSGAEDASITAAISRAARRRKLLIPLKER